ncbi:ATP-grasp domain-containing protein [Mesorhizobium sp. ASY16-5R]|uniref:ATP-grasp domain-containing protein n=1 Tax=Mesorhizobium sp. ASY16-5R TaxID=3445772 RepID=UPI003F9F71EF
MTVTWILESNVFAEACFDEMLAHLRHRRLPHHVVRIIPFIHEIDGVVPEVSGPAVVYGSIGVQKLAQRQGWKPGVFTNAEFATSVYKQLGDLFLNLDAVSMPMSAVAQWLRSYEGEHFFIKPDGDNKEFAGTVMSKDEFAGWFLNIAAVGYLDGNDFDVAVSRPKKLGCEWRVVVVDGRIVTSSLYKQWRIAKAERHVIPEVEAAVLEAHKRFAPAPAYVIDIAQADDAYKVVEYNTLNSAGFYDCDVRGIIDAVTDLVERMPC